MSRCKGCGIDLGYKSRKFCHNCMKKWLENREKAFKQALSEIGPLNAINLKAIQTRVKKIEKGLK